MSKSATPQTTSCANTSTATLRGLRTGNLDEITEMWRDADGDGSAHTFVTDDYSLRHKQIKLPDDTVIATYTFQGYSKLIKRIYNQNSTQLDITYNTKGLVDEFKNSSVGDPNNPFAGFKYAYDDLYRRTSVKYLHEAADKYDVYKYDKVSRLTKVFYNSPNTTPPDTHTPRRQFVYDAAGNRTKVEDNGIITHTYTPNKANEYDIIDNANRFHDDKGNYVGLTNYVAIKYHWDYANRLACLYIDFNLNNKWDFGDDTEWVYTYDTAGTSYSYKTRNYYDAHGNLEQIIQYDSSDNAVGLMIYAYDILGHQTDQWVCHTIPNPTNYNPVNDKSDAIDNSVHTHYEYDASENLVLTEAGDSTKDKTGTIYDERNMVWQQLVDVTFTGIDPTGTALVSYFYDGNGNLTAEHDGRQTPSYPIDPESQTYTTTYLYDGFARKVATASPSYTEGGSTYYAVSYSELDKAGLATYRQTRKATSRPTTIDDAKSTTGRINKTSYKYDKLNRRYETKVEDLEGANHSITKYYYYVSSGKVKSLVEDPTGLESFTLTDWLGRTTKREDNAGDYIQNTYDDNYTTHLGGNLEKVLTHEVNDGTGNYYLHYKYDTNGRLEKTGNSGTSDTINWITPGTALVTTYTYDDLGRTDVVTDPKSIPTKTYYTDAGKALAVVRFIGDGAPTWPTREYIKNNDPVSTDDFVVTKFAYNDKGQKQYVQDDKGKITYNTYKQHYGLPEYTYYGSNNTGTSYSNGVYVEYNVVGNATAASVIDGSGNPVRTVTRVYDNRGMMTKEYLSSAGTLPGMQAKTFEYDALGRMVLAITYMVESSGDLSQARTKITYTYNSLGRLTEEKQGLNLNYTVNEDFEDTGEELTVTYNSHDDAGRLGQITYPAGRTIQLDRSGDALKRVRYYKDTTGTEYTIAAYTYTGSSRLDTRTYDQTTDTQLDVDYDGFRRVADFAWSGGGGGLPSYTYAYDKTSNRTSEYNQTTYEAYTYDKQNQITDVHYNATAASGTGATRTTDFTLDTVNNRTEVDDTLGSGTNDVDYTLNDLHQYSSLTYGGTGYTRSHDNAGNLTDDGANDYTWDYNDKLNSFYDGSNTTDYVYDAMGRRVLKDASTDTRYIYNGWQCIEEYDVTGTSSELVADYVYGNNIDEILQARRDLNGDGDFLDANEVVYYHTNVQGNVVAISDSSGQEVEKIEYDIYGRITGVWVWDEVNEEWDAISQSGDFLTATEYYAGSLTKNPLLFQGRRLDAESGLYYFRNRQYDPVHGRFLSRDPEGYKDSFCLYQFVNNNPVCYTDPMGLGLLDLARCAAENAWNWTSDAAEDAADLTKTVAENAYTAAENAYKWTCETVAAAINGCKSELMDKARPTAELISQFMWTGAPGIFEGLEQAYCDCDMTNEKREWVEKAKKWAGVLSVDLTVGDFINGGVGFEIVAKPGSWALYVFPEVGAGVAVLPANIAIGLGVIWPITDYDRYTGFYLDVTAGYGVGLSFDANPFDLGGPKSATFNVMTPAAGVAAKWYIKVGEESITRYCSGQPDKPVVGGGKIGVD